MVNRSYLKRKLQKLLLFFVMKYTRKNLLLLTSFANRRYIDSCLLKTTITVTCFTDIFLISTSGRTSLGLVSREAMTD